MGQVGQALKDKLCFPTGQVCCRFHVKKDRRELRMVNTAIKDGKALFDALTLNEINDFVNMAKEANLLVALAGSIKQYHVEDLIKIDPDIIGVRGAVCEGPDRHSKISMNFNKFTFIN